MASKPFPSARTQRNHNRARAWRKKTNTPTSSRRHNSSLVTYHSLHGGQINPGPNPPNINYQPWNHVVLAHVFKTQESIQVKTIPGLLKSQLDPTGRGFNQTTTGDKQFVLQLKIHKIRAWNLTGNMIAMSVDDFLDSRASSGGREQLCGLVDTGSPSHVPAVGYTLPMSHRQHVLRSDDQENEVYICNVQLDSSQSGIIYVDLQYRFDGPVTPPALTTMLGRIMKNTNELREEVQQQRREVGVIGNVMDSLAQSFSQAVVSVGKEKLAVLISSVLEEGTSHAPIMVEGLEDESPSHSFSDLGDAEQC